MEERIKKLSIEAAKWWNSHLQINSMEFIEELSSLLYDELEANKLLSIKCGPDEVDQFLIEAAETSKVLIRPDKQMLMIISIVMGNMVFTQDGFIQISV